jgi:hypothetical protein
VSRACKQRNRTCGKLSFDGHNRAEKRGGEKAGPSSHGWQRRCFADTARVVLLVRAVDHSLAGPISRRAGAGPTAFAEETRRRPCKFGLLVGV